MSRDISKDLGEIRKKGGWPLYTDKGKIAIVPSKVMRCPKCGSEVEKKQSTKREVRETIEGLPWYKCKHCHHEFAQVKKEPYCSHFKRNIRYSDCRTCPVGRPYLIQIAKAIRRGEDIEKSAQKCPHFLPRLGMDYTPEGVLRDTHVR